MLAATMALIRLNCRKIPACLQGKKVPLYAPLFLNGIGNKLTFGDALVEYAAFNGLQIYIAIIPAPV